MIRSITEDIKEPIIVIAKDRSASIKAATNKDVLQKFERDFDAEKEKLKQKYTVVELAFGDEVVETNADTLNYKVTNIANAMEYIFENYADQNVGAVIMTSDGIYNEGKNPLYANVQFTAPVHTIALGDTVRRKDLLVKNILNNKIAYLNDKIGLSIDLEAFNCKGNQSKLKIEKITDSGKSIVHESTVTIPTASEFMTKEVVEDANVVGLNKFVVSLSPITGEYVTANNTKETYVEVLDGRQKILLLANAPNPDLAAISSAITDNKNYQVTTAIMGEKSPNYADFDLVIFHNLPSKEHDIASILTVLNRKNCPRLFVAGTQIDAVRFNQSQSVLSIQTNGKNNEEVEPNLDPKFVNFNLSEATKKQISRYAPLNCLFGTYQASPSGTVMMTQKIKKIATKYPLIAFDQKDGSKIGVIAGEGIWKWRMLDFVANENFDMSTEILMKSMQYLTVKEDKRKFRVNLAKNLFKENEKIIFDAQLYNNSYQLINEPDVFLSLKNGEGKEFKYSFSKTQNFYTLDIGQLPAGNYSYEANTNFNGQKLDAKGRFTVQNIQQELYDLTARHDVLAGISKKFNGIAAQANDFQKIFTDIASNKSMKPVVYPITHTQSIINKRWIFFLLLLLLGGEWFIRRYFGGY